MLPLEPMAASAAVRRWEMEAAARVAADVVRNERRERGFMRRAYRRAGRSPRMERDSTKRAGFVDGD